MTTEAAAPDNVIEEPAAAPPPYVVPAGLPVFTWCLIALLAIIFLAEIALNNGELGELGAPSVGTLFMLGGATRDAVVNDGEWWRLLTAPLLHADFAHIGFNCLALFLVTRLVEPIAGWRWTAATFAVSAVCGTIMSISLNPPNIVGIGASGGIVGVFVLAIYVGLRLPAGRTKSRLISQATYSLISAVLPFLHSGSSTPGGSTVDYAAHIGGALGGAVIVAVLAFGVWPRDRLQPRGGRIAVGIAGIYFAAAALSIIPISGLVSGQSKLDPNLPAQADLVTQGPIHLKQYPHDPRLIFTQGLIDLQNSDFPGAEAQFRAAAKESAAMPGLLTPAFNAGLQGLLAEALQLEGKMDEAKSTAAPICDKVNEGIGNALVSSGVCSAVPAKPQQ